MRRCLTVESGEGEWTRLRREKKKQKKEKKEIIGISHVSHPREAILPNQTTQTASDSQMNLP
jgi:hypothetical protein